MITIAEHRYIATDPAILDGEPIIVETRTPVRAIVELYRLGLSLEEIQSNLPHLSVAKIFDALSFYSDNFELINAYIQKNKVETTTDLALNE
jgi:uncharacterized protein (DUF433 family)